jgi:hypothetical protein
MLNIILLKLIAQTVDKILVRSKNNKFHLPSTIATATASSYLVFRANVLKGTDLLLSHCRHDCHHKVLSFTKPIFNLYTGK